MKRTVTRYSLVASFIIILLSFDVDGMLVRFFLAGEIPGTDAVLSPTAMLTIIGLLAVMPFVFIIAKEPHARLERQITEAKKRLPKRRYSSVS